MKGVLPLVLLVCGCPPVLPDVPVPDSGRPATRSFKHAHNDYEHPRPLLDALDQNFESVEADVWLDGNDLGVSHNGAPFKGSLKALYLDPLAAKARAGSLPRPFFLWLDLKQGDRKLLDLIATQLAEYPMLTRFMDDGPAQPGQVTVILKGNDAGKKSLVARAAPRPYARDSNSYSPMDPPSDNTWGAYALNYFSFMQWNGEGTLPPVQQKQLENLVNGAHQLGRQVRLYGSPETPAYWKAAKAAGVDFVGGDDLAGIAAAFAQ